MEVMMERPRDLRWQYHSLYSLLEVLVLPQMATVTCATAPALATTTVIQVHMSPLGLLHVSLHAHGTSKDWGHAAPKPRVTTKTIGVLHMNENEKRG